MLLDHLGEGRHVERDGVHRVSLGANGWFDPFSAIEEALHADRPRADLARAVRRAEAEARGDGPIARVHASLDRALAHRAPAMRVAERFERHARLTDGVELDLGRVLDATDDEPASAVDAAVERLVSMLPGGDGRRGAAWDEAADKLLPRLVGERFVAELAERAGSLYLEPFAPGLTLALLLSHGERARYVRADEARSWAERGETPRARAVANLAARSSGARFTRIDTDAGPFVVAASRDGLDAARLVLPTLASVLGKELGLPFIAAVPHRDTLLACAREPASLVASLRARAIDEAARAPHAISDGLFVVREDGTIDSLPDP